MIDLRLGDCLEVLKEIPDNSVDSIVTDPPYGVGFPYLGYDDTRDNLRSLIDVFMPQALRVASRVLVMCGTTQLQMYPEANWCCSLTWNTTGSHGRYGFSQWTPLLAYGKDVKGFGSVNGVLKSDVIRISGGGGVGFMRGEKEKKHTCPKPITLMDAVIQRYTEPASLVLDPFMGSGTTGVSCAKLGRNFIGIEREPEYYEIAKARIESAQNELKQLEIAI